MYNTIKELWYGNVSPIDNVLVSKNLKSLYQKLNEFEKNCQPLIKENLILLNDIYSDIIDEYQVDAFVQGFSLAIKLALDVFYEK